MCILKAASFLILCASMALAQTSVAIPEAPVKINVSTSAAQAENVSGKEVVLIAVTVKLKMQKEAYPAVHDFYFKSGGVAPGEVQEVVHGSSDDQIISVTPLFVQFADGSTWGDTKELEKGSASNDLISMRPATVSLYQGALNAFNEQGEQAFISYLSNATGPARGMALSALKVQRQSGTAAAVEHIQKRYDTARYRPF